MKDFPLVLMFVAALVAFCCGRTAEASTTLETLRTFPKAAADTETAQEREARLVVLATAIDDTTALAVCSAPYASTKRTTCHPIWTGARRELAAYLITVGWWESRFAQNVHALQCREWECDAQAWRDVHGNLLRVLHRARSPWQFQRWGYVAEYWDAYRGADLQSTRLAAWAAARVLSRGVAACGTPAGAFTYYAAGGRCRSSRFSQAPVRAAWMRRLLAR